MLFSWHTSSAQVMDTLFEVADVLFRCHALQRRGHGRDVRLHPVSFEFEVVRLCGRQHLVTCSNALQSLLALVWQLRQHQSLFIKHSTREAARWNGRAPVLFPIYNMR